MSVNLLGLFSLAMITAVIAKMTAGYGGLASAACVGLLVLFAVLTRVHGVRKPVV